MDSLMSHQHHDHAHARGGQPHPHDPPSEDYAARKHPEFVALDIGGDAGALIVHTDPGMHGVEIEISPSGRDEARSHKQVLERTMEGRPAFTAVFDGLRRDRYTLWVDDRPQVRDVPIEAARIAELDWRGVL